MMIVPPRPVLGELTSVRPATGADADLLVRWHRDPEVARYWDNETFTHEQMRVRLARRDVHPYIIEAACEPIGYLQVWFADAPGDAGLDMFLIPAARGRGFGPDAARAVANYLLRETDRNRLTVDPYLSNARAIRAWQKAGFRPVEQRPPDVDHTETWLLMTAELTSSE
jgi:aminoglycoside 6'-N-acetyltransferase